MHRFIDTDGYREIANFGLRIADLEMKPQRDGASERRSAGAAGKSKEFLFSPQRRKGRKDFISFYFIFTSKTQRTQRT